MKIVKYLVALVLLLASAGYYYFVAPAPLFETMSRNFVSEATANSGYVVSIDSGKALGYRHETGVLRFTGIPFAEPPVGDFRFLAPQPIKPWEGILDARKPGPGCVQGRVPLMNPPKKHGQSEDCLWLSVNTPAIDQGKRPVIVWIHGGGFYAGGNAEPLYDGANITARGDIVFVNLQYRLGALGWLDVSHLGDDEALNNSHHNGTRDQVAGLEWIQRNIALFGGDPNNVTIMGESAGSGAVAALLERPQYDHLFHKAIMHSYLYNPLPTPTLRQSADTFMEVIGASSLAELRTKSAAEIRKAEEQIQAPEFTGSEPATLLYDPRNTRKGLAEAAKRGKPVLHGDNTNEVHFLKLMGGDLEDPAMFFTKAGFNSEQVDRISKLLQEHQPQRSEIDNYLDALSGISMHYSHFLFSEDYSEHAPVFHYQFDWASPDYPELGAFHSLELPFVFDNFPAFDLGQTEKDRELALQMLDAWVAFARTGNPNHDNMPDWPNYNREQRPVMVFNTESKVEHHRLPWVWELRKVIEEVNQASQ